MVFGAGIECLRDDDGADDDPEQRACDKRRAGARPEQPERAALVPKLAGSEGLDAGNV